MYKACARHGGAGKEMKWVNLTPHKILLYRPDGSVEEVPPSGRVVRVKEEREEVGEVGGLPVFSSSFGEVEGLPDPEPGVYLLVSRPVLEALKGSGRVDVLAPDTGVGAVRSKEGKIVGVKALLSTPHGVR